MVGKVRLQRADRNQFRLEPTDLDQLVPRNHQVRAVWDFVGQLDLARFHEAILAREGHAGRPPIDPAILLCLWLYATVDDIGSARELERLTAYHHAYRWICGGVSVNYHTLSDFRVAHGDFLDDLLTSSVVALMEAGVATLDEVAQDGLRTRAAAGTSSFRRKATLESKLEKAKARIERLKDEVSSDPAASNRRRQAAEERAAREVAERARAALDHLAEIEKRREQQREKHKKRVDQKREARASLTDPQARIIKMADGGYRPAYNLQIAMDTASGAVVGIDVTNESSDKRLIAPMLERIRRRFTKLPKRWLADAGYSGTNNVEHLAAAPGGAIEAYVPLPSGRGGKPARKPRPAGPVITAWRARMQGDEGKAVYKRRCLVEWVNAGMRNRGLTQLTVRGKRKVEAVLLWQAVAHNLLCLLRADTKIAQSAA
jgi:transposase